MVSGLDTDTIVSELMEAERIPLDKLYQKKQLAEWTQEAYREISSSIRVFYDKYFDILNADSCMLSQSNYKIYRTTSTDESVVKITASTNSTAGSHTVTVSNLATSAVYESESGIIKDISASSIADYSSAAGKDFILELDGEKYTITIDSSVASTSDLQGLIDETVGSEKIKASEDSSGYLVISAVYDSGVHEVTISDGTVSALSSLGFSTEDNLSNMLDETDTLEAISGKMDNPFSFDSEGQINLTINGVSFEFDKADTLSDMMDEINSSDAGVTMKYNHTSNTFTFTANETGAGNRINISETGSNFLDSTGILTNYTAGEDSVIYIDGEKVLRSSNSIVVNGTNIELLAESSTPVTVSIALDTDSIYDKIEAFVEDYNTLIDKINDKTSEDYDNDYPPLTDEEKEELSEDEIETWEKKAKVGLLEDDSILSNMLSSMRSALYTSVSGVSNSLYNIGITTTGDYNDNGKLIIDENKLKKAIENNPDEVMNLFSKESETYSGTFAVRTLDSKKREVRTSEEGLAYRLYDIIQDNISTSRNSAGTKGLLLEKAGVEGDTTEYNNSIYNEVDDYEDAIDSMIDKLNEKEDYYYEKFAAMETYISNMNSQLSALQSMLG